jgi:L-ascorbate metabolism protein UlaG (beta-lactamase superfamily)
LNFTYFGHSCFLLETKGYKILFDPFISPNEMAKHIDVNAIAADYIAVSHGHEDHVADLVSIAKNTKAKVIACYELGDYLTENNIDNFHGMNIGGSFKFDFGTIMLTNAIHSNSLNGRYLGAAGGFVINNEEGSFYYAGDTALTYDMKLIAAKFKIDFAALPIGGNFTMDYKDAFMASDFIQCQQIIALHYDTFEPIKINKMEVLDYFKSSGKKLHFLEIGQNISF